MKSLVSFAKLATFAESAMLSLNKNNGNLVGITTVTKGLTSFFNVIVSSSEYTH